MTDDPQIIPDIYILMKEDPEIILIRGDPRFTSSIYFSWERLYHRRGSTIHFINILLIEEDPKFTRSIYVLMAEGTQTIPYIPKHHEI